MSQAKVSEYFSKRKKCDGLQPSKRRKVITANETETNALTQLRSPPIGARTRSRQTKVCYPTPTNLNAQGQAQNSKMRAPRSTKSRTKVPVKPANQKSIVDVLSNVCDTLLESDEITNKLNHLADAVPTAAADNHNASPPNSPTKRRPTTDETQKTLVITKKRSRCKAVRRDLFLEGNNQVPAFNYETEAPKEERKVASPKHRSMEGGTTAAVFQFHGKERELAQEARMQKLANEVFAKVGETILIKPEQSTSVRAQVKSDVSRDQQKVDDNQAARKTSITSMEKLKLDSTQAVKRDPTSLKAKLSQCSNLADLKEKLRLLKQASPKKTTREEVKIQSPVKLRLLDAVQKGANSPVKVSKPAHESFSMLDAPIPPGLSLPKHYKLLHNMFISADTVVSMLHKRAEICTFSKLKAAVQEMTKKKKVPTATLR